VARQTRIEAATRPGDRRQRDVQRLSREKGVLTLLKAAEHAGVPLVLAGDGPLRECVSSARWVTYAGVLAEDELKSVRSRAAFLVAPSECPEVSPFAVLEALAEGLPIIASATGGLPEIATGGAVHLVPPGDERALSDGLAKLWRDREARRGLAARARPSIEENYSLDKQTDALLRVYAAVQSGS
jgi:glycosyltransferase involved in cell wall biosynthesis